MRGLAVISSVLLTSCFLTGATSLEERAWAKSPDGLTHAILTETNGGATTAFGYLVELHPADHEGEAPVRVGNFYDVVSYCAYGLDMLWTDARTARRSEVTESTMVGGKRIRVVLKTGVKESARPCRGMVGRPRLG